jgi:hypothetical protein
MAATPEGDGKSVPTQEPEAVQFARDGFPKIDPAIPGTALIPPEALDRPDVRKAVEDLFEALDVPNDQVEAAIEEAKMTLGEGRPAQSMRDKLLALAARANRDGDKHSAASYRRQAEQYSMSASG